MPRIKSLLSKLAQPRFNVYFYTDATNGYQGVLIFPPHIYKTAFLSIYRQLAYTRIGQGLTRALGTYTRLKAIVIGPILQLDPEKALPEVSENVEYRFFIDDNIGAATTFNKMFDFLYYYYFPRVVQVKLTLAAKKLTFFLHSIKVLGYNLDKRGLRPSLNKVEAFEKYLRPDNKESLQRLVQKLPQLSNLLPGRANLILALKTTLVRKLVPVEGRTRRVSKVVGFKQNDIAEDAF